MNERRILGEQAYRLTESCIRRRDTPTLVNIEKVAGMTLKMLEADIPVEEIEWVLINAKVLTEAGIEFTRNNRPAVRHRLKQVEPTAPAFYSDEERLRVREIIAETRANLIGPKSRGLV